MLMKNTIIVIVVALEGLALTRISEIIDSEDVEKYSTACIGKIIATLFPCGTSITIATGHNFHSSIKNILYVEDCYSILNKNFIDQDWISMGRSDVYIILAEDITEFANGIAELADDILWNPRAKFIIQVADSNDTSEIFNSLVKHNIYDAIVIDYGKEDMTTILHRNLPIDTEKCKKQNLQIKVVGRCSDTLLHTNIKELKSVPNITLQGCVFKIAVNEDIPNVIYEARNLTEDGNFLIGMEEMVVKHFAAKEGFAVEFICVDYEKRFGVILDNKTVTGVLGYMRKREAQLVAGGFILTSNRIKFFDFVWGHTFADIYFFMAKRPKDLWKKIYKEFTCQSWTAIASFCLVFTFIFVLRNYQITGARHGHISVVIMLWGYLFNNANQRLPNIRKLRPLLACWIAFTFLISNFYNTAFFSIMAGHNQNYINIYQTKLDYLINTYQPCLSESIRLLFRYNLDDIWKKNNMEECNSQIGAFIAVSSNQNLFGIEFKNSMTMNEMYMLDCEGNSKIDRWILASNTAGALYFERGFPLLNKLQKQIRQMVEAGILQNHVEKINLKIERDRQKKFLHKKACFKQVALDQYYIPSIILALGCIISTVLFAFEVLKNKLKP